MDRDALKAKFDAMLPKLQLAQEQVGPWRALNPAGYFIVPRTERYSVWFDEAVDIDEEKVAALFNPPGTP